MKTDEIFTRELRDLERKLQSLEKISLRTSDYSNEIGATFDSTNSYSHILKRLNSVLNIIDQIEIEVDKMEMRVSAIEHMGFRLRTGSQ